MCTVGQLLVRAPLPGSFPAGTFLGVAGAWEDSRHAQILTSRHDSSGGGRAEHHSYGAGPRDRQSADCQGTERQHRRADSRRSIYSRIIGQQRRKHGPQRYNEDKRAVAWRVTRYVEETGNDHGIDVNEHVQWHDHDDGEHRHDIDSTAHVRAQCDLHEDLEEPQPAHQSEGDAADGDDD